MRDPLIDPRPSDVVVSKKGKKREVVYVTIRDQVVYDAIGKKTRINEVCDLKTWKRWARGASILKRGTDEPLHPHGRPMASNRDLDRQTLSIANRVMDAHNRRADDGDKIHGSPDTEAMLAIFEIGLAHYWSYDYSAREKVRDRIVALYRQKMAARRKGS